MNETMHKAVQTYAEMVLRWLDIDANEHHVKRADLVELFIDTLNALEQNLEQR